MKKNKRVVGQLIASAPVNTAPDEATIPDSRRSAIKQALAQLGQALAAFGPFALGCDMAFVQAGIKVDVLDASKTQDIVFDEAEFAAFVQRARNACTHALDDTAGTPEQLATGAEQLASAEGRSSNAMKALFASMAAHTGASIISPEGELIDIGIATPAEDEHDTDLEIEVARVRCIARIKTADGQYDLSPDQAQGLRVGDRIHPEGVEAPTGAACIRADRIDSEFDPSGELFDGSARTKAEGDPDDAE